MPQKLGQHFLKDENALGKIVAALEVKSPDTVIEIGPGHGELTRQILAANPHKLIAIERDPRLAAVLRKDLSGPKLEIIDGDALKILPGFINETGGNYKIVGNIPYYITGYLLRTLGELEPKPELIVLTIQKEVAERVCAAPPKMNLLAASVQFWAEPKIRFIIKKGAFSPPPKVDSAVLKLKPQKIYDADPSKYYQLIKVLFKQPRKTILNNLAAGSKLPKSEVSKILDAVGVRRDARPQTIGVPELKSLSGVFRIEK